MELEAIGAASAESRARRILAVSENMELMKFICSLAKGDKSNYKYTE